MMMKQVVLVVLVVAATAAAFPPPSSTFTTVSSTFTTVLNLTEPNDIVSGTALHTRTSSGPIVAYAGTSPSGDTVIVAPYSVEAAPSPSATPLPVHAYASPPNSALLLRAAEGYDSPAAGDVFLFTAHGVRTAGSDTDVCVVKGYSQGKDPVWSVSFKGCGLVFDAAFAVSQDASTVVLGYLHAGNGPVIVGIDGQTGDVMYKKDINYGPVTTASCSRMGDRCVFGCDEGILFLSKNGTAYTPSLPVRYTRFSLVCPMGVFLVYGTTSATLRRWNGTVYAPTGLEWHPPASSSGYVLASAAMSVNGGLLDAIDAEDGSVDLSVTGPDGCLIALAWQAAGKDVNKAAMDIASMLSGKMFFQWEHSFTPSSPPVQSSVAFDLNYAVLATGFQPDPHSGSDDMALLLIDAVNLGEPIQAVYDYPVALSSVALQASGPTVIVTAAGQSYYSSDFENAVGVILTSPNDAFQS